VCRKVLGRCSIGKALTSGGFLEQKTGEKKKLSNNECGEKETPGLDGDMEGGDGYEMRIQQLPKVLPGGSGAGNPQ